MLVSLTEFKTSNPITINVNNVVCVFTGIDPISNTETTFVNMINGNIAVSQTYDYVITSIKCAFDNS